VKRKILMSVVVLVGVIWLVGAFALSLPTKTQGVDDLTDAFRPAFTDAALVQAKVDLQTATAFATDFRTLVAPQLAAQLGVTPDQLIASLGAQAPAVADGLTQLPRILTTFGGLQGTMADQQHNFDQADAIPTAGLPNTSVHWLFVCLGILAIAGGAVGLVLRGRSTALAVAILGAVVIATTLLISVPAKAEAVDDLTAALRPIFTTQTAAQARADVNTLRAMDDELGARALPALAGMLHVTPAQLEASLADEFPTVAAGLQQFPAILVRLDGVVTALERNLDNFRLADSIPTSGRPTTDVVWYLIGPSLVLVLAGGAAAVRRRATATPVDARPWAAATEPDVGVGAGTFVRHLDGQVR